jgi:hypothetical protein
MVKPGGRDLVTELVTVIVSVLDPRFVTETEVDPVDVLL